MTDTDDRLMPTVQELNAATFWVVSTVFERPDITAKLLDELAGTGKLPMLPDIARDLGVPLQELCAEFCAEVERRTGFKIAAVGTVQ